MLDPVALRPLVDALIAFTAVEIVLLWLWNRRTGRGWPMARIGANLVSGLLLMVALRCALTPGAGAGMLACVAGSGVCHVLDLRRRRRD